MRFEPGAPPPASLTIMVMVDPGGTLAADGNRSRRLDGPAHRRPERTGLAAAQVERGRHARADAAQTAVADVSREGDLHVLVELARVTRIERARDVGEIVRRAPLPVLTVVVEL